MYDKKKIAIMTKLAVYDKNFAGQDLTKDRYFRHDYIYKRNMRNRIFVFIGCMIVILLIALHKIVYESFDIYSANYTAELVKIILFFAAMLAAYTVIGTAIYTAEFHKSQERLEKYFALLDRLDKYNLAKKTHEAASPDEGEYEQTVYETDETDETDEADEKTDCETHYEEETE